MRQLNTQGMTIVLVAHNMWLIQTVCTRGILLRHGKIAVERRPQLVIDAYRRAAEDSKEEATAVRSGDSEAALGSVELLPTGEWTSDGEATPESGIGLRYAHLPNVPRAKFFIRITSTDGLPFFTVYSEPVKVPSTGRLTCEATIPRLMLHGGDYGVWVGGVLRSRRGRSDIANPPAAGGAGIYPSSGKRRLLEQRWMENLLRNRQR